MILFAYLLLLALNPAQKNSSGIRQEAIEAQMEELKIPKDLFIDVADPFSGETIKANPRNLLKTAESVLHYMQSMSQDEKNAIGSKIFSTKQEYIQEVIKTLKFIVDMLKRNPTKFSQKICDPNFINKNFKCIKWNGDQVAAKKLHGIDIPDGKIRLTNYLVFSVKGSNQKTREYPYALYSVPLDEKGLSGAEIESKKDKLLRFQYTKQDIYDGVLESKQNRDKVKPLVWLSQHDVEEALMQGTISVQMSDGKRKIFNVEKNNDIAYDKKLKDKFLQKRYWYFKEQKEILGYGPTPNRKIAIASKTAFAGDTKNIGLGQLVAIRYTNPLTKRDEIRLGIIADTGGAFENNLYQLDYFTGTFRTRDQFNNFIKKLPSHVEAYFLVKR